MEKRIENLEESVKTLARFVREEIEKLNTAGIGAFDPEGKTGIEKKIGKLEFEIGQQKEVINGLWDLLKKRMRMDVSLEKKEAGVVKGLEEEVSEISEIMEEEMAKKDEELAEKSARFEDVQTLSFRKDLQTMRSMVDQVKERTDDTEHKIKELKEHLTNYHKNIKDVATSVLMHRLQDFASEIDKKYPELATRAEFQRLEDDLRTRIKIIEVPDLTHIEKRVAVLEKKIGDLAYMIQDVYEKVPAVVE